jgi:hypothetical protein
MQKRLKLIFAVLLISWAAACTQKENIYQGIFEATSQQQKMRSSDPSTTQNKEYPPYQQYKRERKEMLRNQEEKSVNN